MHRKQQLWPRSMDTQVAVTRKRKAPPVDPNNSEAVRLAHIAERKKQRLTPKNGLSSTPATATVNKSRAADIDDIDSIESLEDDDKESPQKKQQPSEAAPKKGKSSRAVLVEDVEDIANVQSSHRPKPKNPNTIIESSEGEDEVNQSESEKPTESAEAELSKSWTLLRILKVNFI